MTVLSDTRFVIFCIGGICCTILAGQMMAVLPVYMKDQFGLGETYFGWVMTTNAAMVVVLQLPITRITQRISRLFLTSAGAILYALGVGSIALGSAFPHFIGAMVVYTFGEMVLVPTSTTVTADLAPAALRGRYNKLHLPFAVCYFPHRAFSFAVTCAVKSNVNGETETT